MNEYIKQFIKNNARLHQKAVITQEQRDSYLHFNTQKYWHCFYNPENDHLYNEYYRLITEDAYDYLLEIGLIDKNRNQLGYFQNEDGGII